MDYGICLQSVVALRAEPSHRSEMVSQILFGELFRILSVDKEWFEVELAYDDYRGWLSINQANLLTESEFLSLLNSETAVSHDLVQLISNETNQLILPLIAGSSLPGIRNKEFSIHGERFFFDGEMSISSPFEAGQTLASEQSARQKLVADAKLFLYSPYLWGGRTPFGIDCSGFVQMVYKLQNLKLLRDATQQATQGEALNFLEESQPGDLVFFDNEEGQIIHVGILINTSTIIHSSGKVRIDAIDHQGIYNAEEQRYTHTLRVIKRMI
ncbi:MAG: C40 family peptidase [Bacteroidota bacterium]